MSRIRGGAILVVFLSIIFLPYWLYLPLLGAAMIFFPFFWEGVLLALLIDVLYGGGVGLATDFFSPLALVATLLLIVLLPLRERVRIHSLNIFSFD